MDADHPPVEAGPAAAGEDDAQLLDELGDPTIVSGSGPRAADDADDLCARTASSSPEAPCGARAHEDVDEKGGQRESDTPVAVGECMSLRPDPRLRQHHHRQHVLAVLPTALATAQQQHNVRHSFSTRPIPTDMEGQVTTKTILMLIRPVLPATPPQ